ncbi:hypothetical protein OPU71_18465 [Niveibacterium sp. 24ML]|uniref:hypothetical protein n=1 Tax=Niveibacterium sp. 24ML TaxID=2985512 RepID=UPI00227219D2|nr:hypothetical protein [Niveibacterium sp. 24ML]MCX9158110.1 hypothetical protein [Niveibacterium sp. 24ML]
MEQNHKSANEAAPSAAAIERLSQLKDAMGVARSEAWQAVALAARKPSVWVEQALELAIWIVKWGAVTYAVVLAFLGLAWMWVGGQTFNANLSTDTVETLHSTAIVLVMVCIPFTRWRLPGLPLVKVWQRNYSAAFYKAMALTADPRTKRT